MKRPLTTRCTCARTIAVCTASRPFYLYLCGHAHDMDMQNWFRILGLWVSVLGIGRPGNWFKFGSLGTCSPTYPPRVCQRYRSILGTYAFLYPLGPARMRSSSLG
eukprot:485329-Pleurochrysis_carterae.AAC.2